jgi:hypothetical protein
MIKSEKQLDLATCIFLISIACQHLFEIHNKSAKIKNDLNSDTWQKLYLDSKLQRTDTAEVNNIWLIV